MSKQSAKKSQPPKNAGPIPFDDQQINSQGRPTLAAVDTLEQAGVDDLTLAQLVHATYRPLDQHPHKAKIEASVSPDAPSVGQLRADVIKVPGVDPLYIIAIRGTQGMGNWLANMDARLQPSTQVSPEHPHGEPRPKVHAGFARASETLTPALAEAIPTGSQVIIAGHSLGAAIAVFLVPRLIAHGMLVQRVVTFGCPRVGDANYRDAWHRQTSVPIRRYVNGPDPVCQLPTPLRGYRHIGALRWYSYQGQRTEAGAWMRFGNRLGAYWAAWRTPGSDLLAYHDMRAYVARLQAG